VLKRLVPALALALASTALVAQAPQPAPAPAPGPFDAAQAKGVVEKLASELDDNFVFPDVAKAYAAALRGKLAAGSYAQFQDADAFAEAVTADLQAVHKDGHLRLHPPRGEAGAGPRPMMQGAGGIEAIERSGWIADGIAYISFNMFPGDEATVQKLRSFMADHSSAKTLIIDARTHRGGGLAEMDVMFPYLYGKAQTLVQMDTRIAVEQRRGNPMEDTPALTKVQGPDGVVRRSHNAIPGSTATPLRDAKVFLLTSERTASAAEHLSLSLKRTGRATLIGETTAGAGHYGGMVPLGGGYAAFIPVGRTFDPATNQGKERASSPMSRFRRSAR
jgi:hypothetical protein